MLENSKAAFEDEVTGEVRVSRICKLCDMGFESAVVLERTGGQLQLFHCTKANGRRRNVRIRAPLVHSL